jgi:hypothetical protein
MKCPYAVNRKTTTITNNTFDENGYNTKSVEMQENFATYPECQKENCGAWQGSKCNYNQGINWR